MGMPVDGTATAIHAITLYQGSLIDIQASEYSSIQECYIMLTGKQLLKSEAVW
jgi:hypothetical protein